MTLSVRQHRSFGILRSRACLTTVRHMNPEQTATVRRFNRLVTQRAGALEQSFLGRNRPLGESRVLFEIGEGTDLRELRSRLGLDSGYLSRITHALVAKGLVSLSPVAEDERIRHVRLTRSGRREVQEMNRRSDDAAAAILDNLTPSQRDRLVRSMEEVHRLLRAAAVSIERVDPSSSVARWCLSQYFTELASRFANGFDPDQSISASADDLRPPAGAFLVALADGEALACGAVTRTAATIGSIKRMWVAEGARGLGLGRRILGALETEARQLGIERIRLETNRTLSEAISLYRSAGYQEVPPFNNEQYAHHWFEKHLS